MAQDSSKPDFWESRYRDHVIPWDAGKVPGSLRHYLPKLQPGARILIPGCGSAYEAGYLRENSFDVLAIDFSPAAVELAKTNLAHFGDIVRLADFFGFDPGTPFDAIYERAFLCALPRKMWRAYPERCAQLLKPGGVIAGVLLSCRNAQGPALRHQSAGTRCAAGAEIRIHRGHSGHGLDRGIFRQGKVAGVASKTVMNVKVVTA